MAKRNIIWHSNIRKPSSKQSNQLPPNKPIYELSNRVYFVFVSNLTVKTAHTRTHTFQNNLSHIFSTLYVLAPSQSKVTKHVKQTMRCVVPSSFSYIFIGAIYYAFLVLYIYSQCHLTTTPYQTVITMVRYLFIQKTTPNCNLFGNYLNCRHLAASII